MAKTSKTKKTGSAKNVAPETDEPEKLVPVMDEVILKAGYVGSAQVPMSMLEPAAEDRQARRINWLHIEALTENFKEKDPSTEGIVLTAMIADNEVHRCESLTNEQIIKLAEDGELHIVVLDGNHRITVFKLLSGKLTGFWNPSIKIQVMLYSALGNIMALSLARKKNLETAQCRKETIWDYVRTFRKIKLTAQKSTNPTDEIKTATADIRKSNEMIRKVMGMTDSFDQYKYMYQVAQRGYAAWCAVDAFATAAESGEIAGIPDARNGHLNRGTASESVHALIIFKHIMLGCKTDDAIIAVLNQCTADKSYEPLDSQVALSKAPRSGIKLPAASKKKRTRSSTPDSSTETGNVESYASVTVEPEEEAAERIDPQEVILALREEITSLEYEVAILRSQMYDDREDNTDEPMPNPAQVLILKKDANEQALELALLKMHKVAASRKLCTPHSRVFVDKQLKVYRGGKVVGDQIVNTTCFGTLQEDVTRYIPTGGNCTLAQGDAFYVANELAKHEATEGTETAFIIIDRTVFNDLNAGKK